MQSKAFFESTLKLTVGFVLLSAATAQGIPADACEGIGELLCCEEVDPSSSSFVLHIADALGVLPEVLDSIPALAGVSCTPITVIGVGSGTCNAETVCCQTDFGSGILAIGCVPVDLSL